MYNNISKEAKKISDHFDYEREKLNFNHLVNMYHMSEEFWEKDKELCSRIPETKGIANTKFQKIFFGITFASAAKRNYTGAFIIAMLDNDGNVPEFEKVREINNTVDFDSWLDTTEGGKELIKALGLNTDWLYTF